MNKPSPLTAPPTSIKAKLELVQVKLQDAHRTQVTEFDDVLAFIAHHRRVDATQPSPQPFRRIAIELSQISGVDVTHEAVRRWHRAAELEAAGREPAVSAAE